MSRDKNIDRRLVGNWDKQDKMFHFIVQKYDEEKGMYVNTSSFETEKVEINGINKQYE